MTPTTKLQGAVSPSEEEQEKQPTTQVVERVHFVLPKDEELFFAAAAVVQQYVNHYPVRSKANDVTGGKQEFELQYSLDVNWANWRILLDAGLKLNQNPLEKLESVDAVVDMSDARLLPWAYTGKHVVQVCGTLCGEETTALPKLTQVEADVNGLWQHWSCTNNQPISLAMAALDLLVSPCGVVGAASGATYLAAAMGLPVIELVPATRHRHWLSKWVNPGYRMIVCEENQIPMDLIEQAKVSIKEYLLTKKEKV